MNTFLMIAGILSIVASFLHVAIVAKGAPWYRLFGAGEKMATLAEQGSLYPAIITLGIAVVLFVWAMYAFSGAGLLAPLPYLKGSLIVITTIYSVRGLALFPAYLFMRDSIDSLAVWSSVICIVYGLFHAIGLTQVWALI